jgi:hypothetical protein
MVRENLRKVHYSDGVTSDVRRQFPSTCIAVEAGSWFGSGQHCLFKSKPSLGGCQPAVCRRRTPEKPTTRRDQARQYRTDIGNKAVPESTTGPPKAFTNTRVPAGESDRQPRQPAFQDPPA